jgi:hypothetical protein
MHIDEYKKKESQFLILRTLFYIAGNNKTDLCFNVKSNIFLSDCKPISIFSI